MFIPAYYRNSDFSEISKFIEEHSFATLVSHLEGKPWATHIPLELETKLSGESILAGHISRANPQWKSFSNGERVLAIFQGPHSYVSSSWYNHVNVPTWNYVAVHVYGTMRILNDEEQYTKLKAMVDRYEKIADKPIDMDKLPADMMGKYMKAIVGFEMSMDKVEGKWKMSQNRDEEDKLAIISELEKLNEVNATLVAAEMKNMSKPQSYYNHLAILLQQKLTYTNCIIFN